MFNKETKELEQILENTHSNDISKYLKDNEEDLLKNYDFMKYMNDRIKEKGLRKTNIYREADIKEGYGSKLLTQEKKTRQRDIILRICYAANFTLQETQQALKLYHMEQLYARNERDVVLMIAFNEHKETLEDINKKLEEMGMSELRKCGKQEQ